jgi:hypothetical protein
MNATGWVNIKTKFITHFNENWSLHKKDLVNEFIMKFLLYKKKLIEVFNDYQLLAVSPSPALITLK